MFWCLYQSNRLFIIIIIQRIFLFFFHFSSVKTSLWHLGLPKLNYSIRYFFLGWKNVFRFQCFPVDLLRNTNNIYIIWKWPRKIEPSPLWWDKIKKWVNKLCKFGYSNYQICGITLPLNISLFFYIWNVFGLQSYNFRNQSTSIFQQNFAIYNWWLYPFQM